MTPVDGNIATGHPGRPLVLVVEDEENVAYVVAAALRLSGLEVAQVRTGREALSLLGGGMTPDLVVLDVMLPDLDGFEVCRRVRADFGDVPIAFLTARDAVDDRVRGGYSVTLRSRLAVVAAVLLAVLAVAGSLLVHEVDSSQLQLADQQLASVAQAMGRLGVGTDRALEPAKLGAAQDALSGTYVATLSGGARHVVIASGPSSGTPKAPTVVVPARSSWRHASTVGPHQVRAAGAPCW